MLEELRLENFVLFEKAAFSFGPGLNVISGETGAGKSLVAQALGQALGGRAENDFIRAEAPEARLAAVFAPVHSPGNDNGDGDGGGGGEGEALRLALEAPARPDGRLWLERVLRRGGGGRLTVNGRPVAAAALRPAATRLIDFAAQNEAVRLAEPAYQREVLDRFGDVDDALSAYETLYRRAAGLRERLRAGEGERERMRRRVEALDEQLDRLRAFGFDPQADPFLEERIRALSRSAAIVELSNDAVAALYEEDGAVAETLARLRRATDAQAELLPALGMAAESLAEAAARLDDAVAFYRDAAAAVETGPGDLDAMIERAEALKALARRLETTPDRLALREAELSAERDACAEWDRDDDVLRRDLSKLLPEVVAAGLSLRAARARAAKKLDRAVNRELADLGMNKAGFATELSALWNEDEPLVALLEVATASGLEEVVFTLAPNPGEPAARLAETASGGEMARALLALKTALGGASATSVLFLDEVDAGVGGRLGDVLGRKLHELSRHRQVVCITHLPQVAAWADRHLRIGKSVRRQRTVASARVLDGDERREEIANMIHGAASTATTRRQADEMLEAARRGRG